MGVLSSSISPVERTPTLSSNGEPIPNSVVKDIVVPKRSSSGVKGRENGSWNMSRHVFASEEVSSGDKGGR